MVHAAPAGHTSGDGKQILSINQLKLVGFLLCVSTFIVPYVYVQYLFLYLHVTVATLSMTHPVFLQLVSLERTDLSNPPLSSLCLSLTLYCTSLLCLPFLMYSCCIAHELFTVIVMYVVWIRVW